MAQLPIVLVVARTLQDASEAATNLGLREWRTPDRAVRPARWSGIVYVDGWRRSSLPADTIARAVWIARTDADKLGLLEYEQHDSRWYFTAETGARNAQAALAREREVAKPTAPVSVAPEAISGHAYTLRRLPWWRNLVRGRRRG